MISTIFFAPQVELGLQDTEQEDELLFEDEGERRVQLIPHFFFLETYRDHQITHFRGIKQCKYMVMLWDFPHNSALFRLAI